MGVLGGERGLSLVEVVIALALLGVALAALLQGLGSGVMGADKIRDRGQMLRLAQAQVEDIQKQPYQSCPASYTLVSAIPEGYSIQVLVSPAATYIYTAPLSTIAPEVGQLVTVTVKGQYEDTLQIGAYKVRQ